MRRAARRALVGAVAAIALLACKTDKLSVDDYKHSASKYDALDAAARERLVAARAALDRGERETSVAALDELARAWPDNVALAIYVQELAFAAAPAERRGSIGDSARELAEREPTVVHLLLAARLDPEPVRARAMLSRALESDRDCAWTYYALAHLDARQGRWVQARSSLEHALALDPGHRAARRLEAALLARNGQRAEAIAALEAWLKVTRDDPLIDSPTRVMAELDLAQLELLEGHDKKAREILLGLAEQPTEAVRRLCLLCAVEQMRGEAERALTAAREAEARDTGAVLPLVQQAILQEGVLDDPAAARRAWERVLELADRSKDLGALILGLRARVALERSAPVDS